MTATQLELTPRKVEPTKEEALQVIGALKCAVNEYGDGWITRRELEAVTGLPDRTLRQIASDHSAEILSGQRGYKYLPDATPDELRENIGRLKSQARMMLRRAIRTERAWHRLAHNQGERQ